MLKDDALNPIRNAFKEFKGISNFEYIYIPIYIYFFLKEMKRSENNRITSPAFDER